MNSYADALRLFLLDASSEQRAATKHLLEPAQFQVVAEGSPSPDAVSIARELMPDVIVLNVDDSEGEALRTIELLTAAVPGSPVLAISASSDPKQMRQAVIAGARDYVAMPFSQEDLVGAIHQLAEQQRKREELTGVLAEREHPGQIIVVYGAKGGIGRTTLSTNLAVALAEQGAGNGAADRLRVALVDLDFDFGDVALELDLTPERTIGDLGTSLGRLDPELMHGFLTRHSSGLHVLAAPSRPNGGQAIGSAALRTILSLLARTHDMVLVDAPRELNDNVAAALDISDLVLLMVSNQVASLKNARLALALMRDWGFADQKVTIIMNEAHHNSGVPVADAEAGLDVPIFWRIPHDGKEVGLAQWGRPFIHHQAHSRIAESITGLARALRDQYAQHVSVQVKGVEQ